MSAILHDPWAILFWLFVLILFFVWVFRLAKSERPGTDMLSGLLFMSGVEGMVILGLWSLIKKADQWRRELDQQDEHDLIDQ